MTNPVIIGDATLYLGDCLETLRSLPNESVQCCVTSPPYFGLRDYGVDGQIGLESTPDEYVARLVAVFREVRRVLKSDGTCWVNLGDSYAANRSYQVSPTKWDSLPQGQLSRVPDGLKPKDLIGIPWRVAFALQADGWWLRQDIIWAKCLSGGARVYARTQKGEMPMTVKDLVRLDPATVQLWDGEKWNQVVCWGDVLGDPDRGAKSARRRSAKYRGGENLTIEGDIEVEFRSGERVGCTREHKWPTHRGIVAASDLMIGDVVPVVSLPEPVDPASPSALGDEDTGWFVGMYLAEGSQSDGTLQFAGHQKEVERNNRIKRIAEAFHGKCAVHNDAGNGCTANVNGPMLRALVETYVSGRTAKDKHLNPRCWARSNKFLRALLVGYLEGDGSIRENGSWVLGFTNNDALVADIRAIAARIGASVRLRRGVAINTGTGKKHKCWRGDLVFDRSSRRSPDGEIVAIRQSRARMFHNISLSDDPHTFSLASGICTKNSNPMPESVTDRCTKAHEYLFLLAKSERYRYDADAIKEKAEKCAASSRFDIGKTAKHQLDRSSKSDRAENGLRNRRSVWTIATKPCAEAHFAVMPEALVEPCVLAGSRPGDTVLDPFNGSGTTGIVAVRHGRRYVGIDLNRDYLAISERRLSAAQRQTRMEFG